MERSRVSLVESSPPQTAAEPKFYLPERLSPVELEIVGMQNGMWLVHEKALSGKEYGFDGDDIKAINKAVMNDPLNPHLYGALRKGTVTIKSRVRGEWREASFKPIHPRELPYLFAGFSEEIFDKTKDIDGQSHVGEVLDAATWAHTELIRLHPFWDGNGRTARLTVDYTFQKADLPYLTDWGAKRDEYKDVVDRTYREHNRDIFRKFLAQKLLKSYKELEKDGLVDLIAERKGQVIDYLYRLNPQNAAKTL